MITWKVIPTYYVPYKYGYGPCCRVCSNVMVGGAPFEVLPLYCSKGGFERAQLMRDISIPVYVCSELCGETFIIGYDV